MRIAELFKEKSNEMEDKTGHLQHEEITLDNF